MLPNFVIIGAMKCGTVSLHQYLSCHPEIYMTPVDELDFFVAEKNWQKGLAWYESLFKQSAKRMGERSTSYTKYPTFQDVPERMHRHLPEAKLIYCIRNPIDRIVSHYVHAFARKHENRSFEEAVSENFPRNPYIYYSQYYFQLEQYLEFYSPADIHIVKLDDLAKNRKDTLTRVFQFLEVDPYFTHEAFDQVFHSSSQLRRPTWIKSNFSQLRGMYRLEQRFPGLFKRPVQRPQVSEAFRKKLNDHLSQDSAQLEAYLEANLVKSS